MLGEHMLQTLKYAWDSLLFPPYHFSNNESILNRSRSGTVIPHSGSLWFSAVQSKLLARKYVFPTADTDGEECANAFANISLSDSTPENFQNLNFKDIELFAGLNDPYDTERLQSFRDCVFLTEPRELLSINFNDPHHIRKCLFGDNRCLLEITCTRDGYFHAIAAWFRVQLDDDIVLCSAPDDSNSKNCCWDQAIFPCKKSYRVVPGSKISLFSDWTDGKVVFDILQVTHPDLPVPNHEPLSLQAPLNFITMLNDMNLLEHMKHSAGKFIEQFHGHRSLRIMDMFPVPIFGLTVLRNVHLINEFLADVKLACVVQSQEEVKIIKKIAVCNQIPLTRISFILIEDLDEQITGISNQYFDVIVMNLLHSEGDLNEDVISHVNTLR